jgi:hypothetical protein
MSGETRERRGGIIARRRAEAKRWMNEPVPRSPGRTLRCPLMRLRIGSETAILPGRSHAPRGWRNRCSQVEARTRFPGASSLRARDRPAEEGRPPAAGPQIPGPHGPPGPHPVGRGTRSRHHAASDARVFPGRRATCGPTGPTPASVRPGPLPAPHVRTVPGGPKKLARQGRREPPAIGTMTDEVAAREMPAPGLRTPWR